MKTLITQVLMSFVLLSGCTVRNKVKFNEYYYSTGNMISFNNRIDDIKDTVGFMFSRDTIKLYYSDETHNRTVMVDIKSNMRRRVWKVPGCGTQLIHTRNHCSFKSQSTNSVGKIKEFREFYNLRKCSEKRMLEMLYD